jgi:glucokinase
MTGLEPLPTDGQRLMRLLTHTGPLHAGEVAARSGLPEPKASELLRGLADEGWVTEADGAYAFDPSSGFVVGIDLGASKLRVAIADLAGTVLGEERWPVDRRGGPYLLTEIVRATREFARRVTVRWHRVRAVGIGSPGIVDPKTGEIRLASNVPQFRNLQLRTDLQARFDVPVLADNEVNMSVLAEQWVGHGRGCRNVLVFEVGTGVGTGILLDGEIRRGSHGAAGEVAFLPLGGDPFDRAAQRRGVFESATCSDALLQRYADAGGHASTAREVFESASAAEPLALATVDEEARLLALGISATVAVLDPELVVLGGGIGARPELLEPVRRWLGLLMATPPRVETSAFGNRATMVGALAAALRSAHRSLFGDPVVLPAPDGPLQVVELKHA